MRPHYRGAHTNTHPFSESAGKHHRACRRTSTRRRPAKRLAAPSQTNFCTIVATTIEVRGAVYLIRR